MKHGLLKRSGAQASAPTPVGRGHRTKLQQSCSDTLLVHETAFTYYPRLSGVAQYVTAHANERITLASIAQVAGLERKYFSAYFHAKTGVTWTEWIRLLRVKRAKELIQAQELPIPRLAFASGFSDVRTFERAFKRIVGVAPAEYRASMRPESRRAT